MDVFQKLRILTMAARYDVACTSSGVTREAKPGHLGNAEAAGICHSFASDGRCIALLKVLFTNFCIYDCQYCVNRRSNDVERAAFTPEELADIMINFYKRNYIEGLFLSSAIIKSPNYTMELLYAVLKLVREKYKFNGYIHVKAIPGADPELINATGLLADRMSVNIELPSQESLKLLAPDKTKESITKPMGLIKSNIIKNKEEIVLFKSAPKYVPAGQSTQLIVGATKESDKTIINLSENLYNIYNMKRVFYSAYLPVSNFPLLPQVAPPLLREHRLYQADWLLRYYGFNADEILEDGEDLNLNMDPKCQWALKHIDKFPVEINTAGYYELLRVPGIGVASVLKILNSRKAHNLDFDNLKKLNVVLKRAKYFITCNGKMMGQTTLDPETLYLKLTENKIGEKYEQLSLFSLGGAAT
ncbi:MAG: putative DNA modification/repair radical SAM protein [Clostridiales bacterium]|nr:putative DNA modification/repair radical SAM protein [Clostridiales bacterium]